LKAAHYLILLLNHENIYEWVLKYYEINKKYYCNFEEFFND
jgi:hypothetical protein